MRPELLDRLRCPLSGSELALEALDVGPDGRVEHGLLTGEAGPYPIVAGIPVFRGERRELVDLVRAGEHDRALIRACFGEIAPAGWHRTGDWLATTSRLRGLGHRIRAGHDRGLELRALPLLEPDTGVRGLFTLAYRDLRLRNPEVFAYNWYRYGLPRHLAALAALEWAPRTGPVLDVGCGAGHLTRALVDHVGADQPVLGVDGMFFALHVARRHLAPQADFACVELEALPLAGGSIGGVWASDVLHAISHKAPVARELARVGRPGAWGVVAGLAVAGHDHEYPGRPLSADGYRALFPDATLVGDHGLVDTYLDRRAAGRGDGGADAPTVTALWGPDAETADGAPFTDWPHGRGELVPHLLLRPAGRVGEATRLRLELPTPAFEREHGALRRWTPEEVLVDDTVAVEAAAGNRTAAVEAAIEAFTLLGVPPGYVDEPWAGIGPGA